MKDELKTTTPETTGETKALSTAADRGAMALPQAQQILRTLRVDDYYSGEYFGGIALLAKAAFKSGLFGLLSEDQLFIVLMTGRELGITPTVALRNIGAFKGKTVISSQLQLAKVNDAGYLTEIIENTNTKATVSVQKHGRPAYVKSFTMEDAVRAGLPDRNALYMTNPATMLLNRAIGLACRYGAPEVMNGLYNPDELAEIDDDNGAFGATPAAPASAAEPGTMAEQVQNGWTIEAQEKFVVLMDELFSILQAAKKDESIYQKQQEKWGDRKRKMPAAEVLPALEDFVERTKKAAAETQVTS
jgi:hypothetical protein